MSEIQQIMSGLARGLRDPVIFTEGAEIKALRIVEEKEREKLRDAELKLKQLIESYGIEWSEEWWGVIPWAFQEKFANSRGYISVTDRARIEAIKANITAGWDEINSQRAKVATATSSRLRAIRESHEYQRALRDRDERWRAEDEEVNRLRRERCREKRGKILHTVLLILCLIIVVFGLASSFEQLLFNK